MEQTRQRHRRRITATVNGLQIELGDAVFGKPAVREIDLLVDVLECGTIRVMVDAASVRLAENKDYDPDLWLTIYRHYDRYLKNVSELALNARLKAIWHNQQTVVMPDGNAHPITSFHGVLYWLRKEVLTCEEYRLRKIAPPSKPGIEQTRLLQQPVNLENKCPGGDDYVVRYDKVDRVITLLEEGDLYLPPAEIFIDPSFDDARQDDELRKHYFSLGENVQISAADGTPIPILGDLKHTQQSTPYYFWSTAYEFEPRFFKEFQRDACLIITTVEEFARRLEKAASGIFSHGWHFNHFNVEYFDPYEKVSNQIFGPTIAKDFRYAYQKEYRFFWQPLGEANAVSGPQRLHLGPLHDIAEVYKLPKR
jgi:hypothetical protein